MGVVVTFKRCLGGDGLGEKHGVWVDEATIDEVCAQRKALGRGSRSYNKILISAPSLSPFLLCAASECPILFVGWMP